MVIQLELALASNVFGLGRTENENQSPFRSIYIIRVIFLFIQASEGGKAYRM